MYYNDTSCFVSPIKNTYLPGKCLVYYYITSLFTNAPLQETTYVATDLIFDQNQNLNLTKKELFLFATSKTLFLFNSKLYNQIYGLVMTLLLTPAIANISMGFCKSKLIT